MGGSERAPAPVGVPAHDDVSGDKGGEGGDVVDDLAEREDHPAGPIGLADFAVDAGFEFDIGELCFILIRNKPWADRSGRVEILALGHVELGVAHPVPQGSFVAEGQAGDMRKRFALEYARAAFAEHDLALRHVGGKVRQAPAWGPSGTTGRTGFLEKRRG